MRSCLRRSQAPTASTAVERRKPAGEVVRYTRDYLMKFAEVGGRACDEHGASNRRAAAAAPATRRGRAGCGSSPPPAGALPGAPAALPRVSRPSRRAPGRPPSAAAARPRAPPRPAQAFSTLPEELKYSNLEILLEADAPEREAQRALLAKARLAIPCHSARVCCSAEA